MGAGKEEIKSLSGCLSTLQYKDFTYFDDEAEWLTDMGWRDARIVTDEVREECVISEEELKSLLSGHLVALEASIKFSEWEKENRKDILPIVYEEAYRTAMSDYEKHIDAKTQTYKERCDLY